MNTYAEISYDLRRGDTDVEDYVFDADVGKDHVLWAALQQYMVAKQAFVSRINELAAIEDEEQDK